MHRLTLFLLILALPAAAQAAPDLATVLKQMDASAESFRTLSANVTWTDYTAIVKDTSNETGTMLVRRSKPRSSPKILIDFTQPNPRKVAFENRQLSIFYPKLNTVQIWDLGKVGKLVDQALLLGFGTSGKDLASKYNVRVVGEEQVSGQKATRLELIPKSAQVKEQISKVELWIAQDGAYPVQQKVYQLSGNFRQASYSNLKINVNLAPDAATLHLPAGVTTEYPGR